jgi:hypothetical protein
LTEEDIKPLLTKLRNLPDTSTYKTAIFGSKGQMLGNEYPIYFGRFVKSEGDGYDSI